MSGSRGGGEATEFDFGLGLKMAMMGSRGDEGDATAGGFSGAGGLGGIFSGDNQDATATSLSSSGVYDLAGGAATAFDPYSFKSCGALMGFGGTMTRFTASQRQEFERQKHIYKYMAASMSVPPELLIPMNSKYLSQNSLASYQSNENRSGGKGSMELKQTGGVGGNRDGEPWRCRRTDGKKWRCSRDVAPHQKYCERHSHKARPSRSRKLVESSSPSVSISNNDNNHNNNTLLSSTTSSAVTTKRNFPYQASMPQNPSHFTNSCRFPEWFMKREPHNHNEENNNTGGHYFPQPEMDQIAPAPLPRQFLDAWSTVDKTGGIGQITARAATAASNSSLLTLSMAGGGTHTNQDDKWMGYSGLGGPLAEALCLGIIGADGGHGESSQGLGFIK